MTRWPIVSEGVAFSGLRGRLETLNRERDAGLSAGSEQEPETQNPTQAIEGLHGAPATLLVR